MLKVPKSLRAYRCSHIQSPLTGSKVPSDFKDGNVALGLLVEFQTGKTCASSLVDFDLDQ